MPDYTETIRDLRAALTKERDDARRLTLLANLEQFDREYREMKVDITNLRLQNAVACSPAEAKVIANEAIGVLAERVKGLDYLVKGVVVASVVQIIGGVTLAFIIHGLKL
jgi:hypothetical protein